MSGFSNSYISKPKLQTSNSSSLYISDIDARDDLNFLKNHEPLI